MLVALAPCLTLSRAVGAVPVEEILGVYVRAAQVEERKEVDEATRNALKAKRDRAREARKALETQIKDQYGKKRETWPAEKDEELYRLEHAEVLADADYEYRKVDPKGLSDSVQDLMKSFEGKGLAGRKERVILASSAAEADLIVEVAGRRSLMGMACYLLFTVGPGGRMDAARFAKVPADYRMRVFGLYAWKISGPRPEKPVFYFESSNGGQDKFSCHGTAANAASAAVDQFIRDNYPVLTGR